MKFWIIGAALVALTGCAQFHDRYGEEALAQASAQVDAAVASAERILCNHQTVGSVQRNYTPDRLAALIAFCGWDRAIVVKEVF